MVRARSSAFGSGLLVLAVLFVHQVLDQTVAPQQLLHLIKAILQAFRRLSVDIRHGKAS